MAYTFNTYDYLILVLVLLITIGIGIYHGIKLQYPNITKKLYRKIFKRGQVTIEPEIDSGIKESKMKEYIIASSSMSAIPIALSLLGSFYSSTSLLGMPAEIYEYGMEFSMIILGFILPPIAGAFLTGPLFARLKVLSVFEYIKMRYRSNILHMLVVFCYFVRTILGTAIFIYGPSTTLEALTKIDTTTSIIIIGAVATFYTTIGGIKAVIWTDVFQTVIMMTGILVIIIKGTYDVGGLSELWSINEKGGRLDFFNFNPYPFVRQTIWSLFFGMLVQFGFPYCVEQVMAQRFAAAKNIKTAQIALLLNIPGSIILVFLCCFIGLVLYASFYKCDPISSTTITEVSNPNQLVTYFVTSRLTSIKGIVGLFLAAILSSALSSISSTLNSLSVIIWEDILKKFKWFNEFDDGKATLTAKILVIICGVICTAFSIVVSKLGGNLVQISTTLVGSFGGPILGVFTLSCCFPFANVYGGIFGTTIGFSIGLWLSLGSFLFKPAYPKLIVGKDCFNDTFIYNTTQSLLYYSQSSTTQSALNLKYDKELLNLSGFNRIYGISYHLVPVLATSFTIFFGIVISLITCGYRQAVDEKLLLFKFCNKLGNVKSDEIKSKDNETYEMDEQDL